MEEFDITEFIRYYFSKIMIIVCVLVAGFLISWYYTTFLQVPMYQSDTMLALVRISGSQGYTQSDSTINKNLVSTYREIIKSRKILSSVIENLKLDTSVEELADRISVTSKSDTELIVITVSDESSRVARDIANEIATVFKEEIVTIYDIENVSIVDRAIKEEEPYNIHTAKQYLIGTGAGFLLGSLIVTVMFYFDDSVKTIEDIEQKVELSVLTTVPKYRGKKKQGRR